MNSKKKRGGHRSALDRYQVFSSKDTDNFTKSRLAGERETAMLIGNTQIGPARLLRLLASANEVIALFDPQLRHHLEVDRHEQATRVEGDEHRLVQVVSNLLLKAVKFTPAGDDVRGQRFRDREGDAVIEVADDGNGVEASQQSRVFDMFAQAAPTSGTGFGISLAPVQRIVDMHGGRVRVRGRERSSPSRCRRPRAETRFR